MIKGLLSDYIPKLTKYQTEEGFPQVRIMCPNGSVWWNYWETITINFLPDNNRNNTFK